MHSIPLELRKKLEIAEKHQGDLAAKQNSILEQQERLRGQDARLREELASFEKIQARFSLWSKPTSTVKPEQQALNLTLIEIRKEQQRLQSEHETLSREQQRCGQDIELIKIEMRCIMYKPPIVEAVAEMDEMIEMINRRDESRQQTPFL